MTTVRRRSAEEHYVLFGLQVLFLGRGGSAERSAWRHTEAKAELNKYEAKYESTLSALVVVGFPTATTEPTLRLGSS
jgi:hypothetical protein